MLSISIQTLSMLALIVIAAAMFTNAIEHLGQRLGISAGVVGSIFAATATALPETLIPLLAIFAGGANATVNFEIGVGTILGAPLMLSTLTMLLMAIFAMRQRSIKGYIYPEISGFKRDLDFFLFAFTLALLALYIPLTATNLRSFIGVSLILLYLLYLYLTLRASKNLVQDGHGVVIEEPLYLARLGCKDNVKVIICQLLLGLMLLVIAAKLFINRIETLSVLLHVSPLLLSLLIVPIATELPEKINSILWIQQGKDTLAMGNLTGAMVFQGTLLPALGIIFTPWQPRKEVVVGILITLIAATWLRFFGVRAKKIKLSIFFLNGLLYLTYVILALS